MFEPNSAAAGSIGPTDRLIGPDAVPFVTKSVRLVAGEHKRGDVLVASTATPGDYELCADAAAAVYVLAEDKDTTAGPAHAVVFVQGSFNKSAIRAADGVDLAAVAAALEPRSIFIRESVAGA